MNKRILLVIMAVIMGAFPLWLQASGKLSLRVYGGWAYLQAGDVNPGTQGFFDWGSSYLAPPPGGLIEGGYASLHGGYELGGDIILKLSPKLGIGLGAGYLESEHPYRPEPPMMTITDNPQGQGWIKYFNTGTKLSAIPVRLGAFLTLPLGGKVSFIANAGISGYLKARYEGIWNVNFVYSGKMGIWPAQTFSTEAQKNGPGLDSMVDLASITHSFGNGPSSSKRRDESQNSPASKDRLIAGPSMHRYFRPFMKQGTSTMKALRKSPALPGSSWSRARRRPGRDGQPREAVVDLVVASTFRRASALVS